MTMPNLPTAQPPLRRPLQGVLNIVQFNYDYFIIAAVVFAGACYLSAAAHSALLSTLCALVAAGTLLSTCGSLAASWYIYDYSPLTRLSWLDGVACAKSGQALNLHAGFDESSEILTLRYPELALSVVDFYDPATHTERSIKRARALYPPFPGTRSAPASTLDLPAQRYAVIFVILALHEIRNPAERQHFLQQLKAALIPGGTIVVVEHARDLANFLAFTIGFFHFLPTRTFLNDFAAAGLQVTARSHITPFIQQYTLERR